MNVFLRDGDTVYRTWHTDGRGTEQLGYTFGLIDLLPYGRQEEWQDSPEGWPQAPTYSRWAGSATSPRSTAPPEDQAAAVVSGSRSRTPRSPVGVKHARNRWVVPGPSRWRSS